MCSWLIRTRSRDAAGRIGLCFSLYASAIAGCESPPPTIGLDVVGLEGSFEIELTSATSVRRARIERAGHHELVIAAETVEIRIVDQPDSPPQRCEPGTLSLVHGQSAPITCTTLDVCAGLLGMFEEPAAVEPLFPALDRRDLSFMELQPLDGGATYLATLREGLVGTFPNTPTVTTFETILDIADRTEFGWDDGLLSVVLHPDFPTTPSMFVLYVAMGTPRMLRLSRFELGSDGVHFDPTSETILIEAPKIDGVDSHSGGVVRFGADGFLYASMGDGGFILPPSTNAQELDTPLGKMLRIDVDGGTPYAIPPGNPFGPDGTRPGEGMPEIYAWGFRNPFRWSFDTATGAIWLGDVGAATWEEANLVEVGGNYGWSIAEGTDCVVPGCDMTGLIPPHFAYRHGDGSSAIVGGYVYHGDALPELAGAYLYSDYNLHAVYALRDPYGDARSTVVASLEFGLVGIYPDENGEPLLVGLEQLARLVPSTGGMDTFPPDIAATGCMDIDDPLAPSPDFLPYEVSSTLWSDDAVKRRWVRLPPGEVATVDASGDLDFPPGTVLVKEFRRGGELLETRFLALGAGGRWTALTYRWNDDATAATPVTTAITEPGGGGTWFYPGPPECRRCHTEVAGTTLGLELAQLDRPILVDGVERSQVEVWIERGFLDGPPASPPPELVEITDASVPLDLRVRSYLHANCAQCHRPGAGLRVALDLRIDATLAESGLCDAPRGEVLGDAVVVPGDPDGSVLVTRISTRGPERMPPLGTLVVHDEAVSVIREWITGLPSCP